MRRLLLLAALLIAGCFSANIVLAQTINMRSAAGYCLFTRTGAMGDNNSTTQSIITGRLGTHTGGYTGFNPVYNAPVGIQPAQHELDAATLLQVADDIDAAVAQIEAYVDSPVALPSTMGGLVITPGVYNIPSAVSLSGDVILDGLGQINPLFIFKVGGAFTTTSPYRVLLINGATLDNVYWRMAGAVSFAGGISIFRGTVIATPAGAISFADGATLLGKALSKAGAINLDNNQVSNIELPYVGPLPVELTRFVAERQGVAAQLSWATASEKNNDYFAVERSADGRTFAEVGRVAGHGTSTFPYAYQWTDAHLGQYAPAVYYRLKQVDSNGAVIYSPVRTVAGVPATGSPLQLRAYPNPAWNGFSVQLDVALAGPAILQLNDCRGHMVAQRQLVLVPGSTTLVLSEAASLRPGIYLVQLRQGALHQALRLVQE